jgi:aspartyl-tRNA(Asn)/glutamyl-tRNA(Gln) amidotransferase subunit B
MVQYYEEALGHGADPKEVAKWLTGDVAGYLNSNKKSKNIASIADIRLRPKGLADLVSLIQEGRITGRIAKEILPELLESWEGGVGELVKERGMEAITDPAAIEALVRKVLSTNAEKVAEFKSGKTKLLGFFVGMVLKESGSKADPQIAQTLTEKLLSE